MNKCLKNLLMGIVATGITQSATAATINLVQSYPDIFSATDTSYDYTAPVTSGNPNNQHDGFGTLSIVENEGSAFVYTDPDRGMDDAGNIDYKSFGDFSLTAEFDGSGGFLSGSLTLDLSLGSSDTFIDAGGNVIAAQGDNLVTATINSFGFFGADTTGDLGALEFDFTITGGVWDALNFGDTGGLIVAVDMDQFLAPGSSWNSLGDALFTDDWAATTVGAGGNNMNLFTTDSSTLVAVPAPAAAWLFGSGLIALFSIGKTKRVKS